MTQSPAITDGTGKVLRTSTPQIITPWGLDRAVNHGCFVNRETNWLPAATIRATRRLRQRTDALIFILDVTMPLQSC